MAGVLAGLTGILAGLRYEDDDIREAQMLMDKIMKDSKTVQILIDQGKAEGRTAEARRLLEWYGTPRFGAPSEATRAALDAVAEHERLERMFETALTAGGWDEVLATA